jgi:predicted metal-dependent hydrolase
MTAAFEHFTATLGEAMVSEDSDMFRDADPVMRALFLWHGVEEVEHKAVAYDLYQSAAGGGYLTRASALIVATLMVHLVVAPVFWNMLRLDGATRKPGVILRGLNKLYGRKGILTGMLPEFLDWFRPGFHPWDTGMPEKVAAWLSEYEEHGDPMQASETIYGPVGPVSLKVVA